MFKSLKEKLKLFRKKAKEGVEEDKGKEQPRPKVKEERKGGFFSKFRSKKAKREGPEPSSSSTDSAEEEAQEGADLSKLEGDSILKASEPLVEEGSGLFAKRISEGKLEDAMFELEMSLLESDVAQPVVERIKQFLVEELKGAKVSRKADVDQVIEEALRSSIRKVLSTKGFDFDGFIKGAKRPTVLMFVGVNGTGKTTAIARVAHRLMAQNYTCVLAAGDTFRAGAIEQLTKHADKLGIKIVKHAAGADPAAVAYDALEHAKARNKDLILLDTAGRMQTNINLMDEMKKIRRVASPDMVIFVGDALAGNDAIVQAQKFDEAVGIDGVILTKIDADAKGGAALSIAYTIGKPILFIGTGQDYGDLVPFDPDWLTDRLFED